MTAVLAGTILTQVDQIWIAFCSSGVANPPSVIEQITYLLFIKRPDKLHTLAETKAQMVDQHVFPFLRSMGEEGLSYGTHMRNARLGFFNTIGANAIIFAKVLFQYKRNQALRVRPA